MGMGSIIISYREYKVYGGGGGGGKKKIKLFIKKNYYKKIFVYKK
jgi:hypothetical protein